MIVGMFVAYAFGYLHVAFWMAVSWGLYLSVGMVMVAKLAKDLDNLDEKTSALLDRVKSQHTPHVR